MSIDFLICKCNVTFSFYFIAFTSFMIIMDTSYVMILGILSTIIHEAGHLSLMLYQGKNIRYIKFGLFNIDIIDGSRNSLTYRSDIITLSGGPMANLAVSLICIIIYMFTRCKIAGTASYENLCIGLLNLLPIESLDGGQMLFLALEKVFPPRTVSVITMVISLIFLLPLAILGFIILLRSKYNFSLLFMSCYLIAFLFLKEDIC